MSSTLDLCHAHQWLPQRRHRRGAARNTLLGFIAGAITGGLVSYMLFGGSSQPAPRLSSINTSSTGTATPESSSESSPEPAVQATVEGLLSFADELLANLKENVQDYEAKLVSREVIKGKYSEGSIQIKIRNPDTQNNRGLAAYFFFLEPKSSRGREVIWVDGKYDNKLVVHEAGLKRMMGTLQLDPDGRLAMLGQKYPAYEVGMIRLVEKLIEKGQNPALQNQAQISIRENVLVGDVECRMIQVTLPDKSPDVDFHIAQIFVDLERMIPVRYAAYMWPDEPGSDPPLEEEYTYHDVKLNVGLSDADFDPENESYDFP